MDIVIIGPAFPYRGGIASFDERMAFELQKAGHQVSIYTFTLQYPAFLFPGKTQYSEKTPPKNLKIHRKINSVNPFNWWKVGNELRELAPDLVLVKFWIPFIGAGFGALLRRIKRNKKTKIIAVLDNIVPHEKRIGDQALTRYFIKPADAFLSLSKTVENELAFFDTDKPRAINPHPVYDNFGALHPREEAAQFLNLNPQGKYMLFFGLIRDYKGLDWLLKAFQKTRAKASVKLLIAGEFYADQKRYEKLIDKLGLRSQVVLFDHYIKEEEVAYFFSLANVVVQPYKTATQSGITQIAYHFNCPMIVTDVGGLPEIVPNGKIGYVAAPNIEAIAQAIDKYFAEDAEAAFRANFAEEKKKYSWSALNNTILSLYNRLQHK